MAKSLFFELFADYDFAVSEANRRSMHAHDKRLQAKGKGHLKSDGVNFASDRELLDAGNEKKVKEEQKRKINQLLKAINSLHSQNDTLDLTWQIDEEFRQLFPDKAPVHWYSLKVICEKMLSKAINNGTNGRPKNEALAAALECFISYRLANGLSVSASSNGNTPNETVCSAQAFLREVSYLAPISNDALIQRFKRLSRDK